MKNLRLEGLRNARIKDLEEARQMLHEEARISTTILVMISFLLYQVWWLMQHYRTHFLVLLGVILMILMFMLVVAIATSEMSVYARYRRLKRLEVKIMTDCLQAPTAGGEDVAADQFAALEREYNEFFQAYNSRWLTRIRNWKENHRWNWWKKL